MTTPLTQDQFTAALTAQFPDRTWGNPNSHLDAWEIISTDRLYVGHFPGDPKPWLVESGQIAGEGVTLAAAWQAYLEDVNK
jgi:hypothetical protein